MIFIWFIERDLFVYYKKYVIELIFRDFCLFCFRYDVLCIFFRYSKNVRFWFVYNVFFNVLNRFFEYFLECFSVEVRGVFVKFIVFIAYFFL